MKVHETKPPRKHLKKAGQANKPAGSAPFSYNAGVLALKITTLLVDHTAGGADPREAWQAIFIATADFVLFRHDFDKSCWPTMSPIEKQIPALLSLGDTMDLMGDGFETRPTLAYAVAYAGCA